MANNVIQIVVKLLDKATAPLRDLQKKLADLTKKKLGKIGVAAVVGGVAVGLYKVIQATKEQQSAIEQVRAALESTRGVAGLTLKDLQEQASEFQRVTRFSDEAVNRIQSKLLTFTKIGKGQFKDVTEAVLNLATRMEGDLGGATVMVGKAMQDPLLGVTALRRAGVQLSEQQQDLVKQFVRTGQHAKAQGVILQELATQFKNAARFDRNTLGGAIDGLRNAWGELLEATDEGAASLIKALNDAEARLSDPSTRAAAAALADAVLKIGTAAIVAGGWVGTLVGTILEGARRTGEAIARWRFGEADPVVADMGRLNELLTQRQDLLRSIAVHEKRTPNWLNKDSIASALKTQREELANVEAEIATVNARLVVAGQQGLAAAGKPAGGSGGGGGGTGAVDPEVVKALVTASKGALSAIQSVRTEQESATAALVENILRTQEFLDQWNAAGAATRTAAGLKQADFDEATLALDRMQTRLTLVDFGSVFEDGKAAIEGTRTELETATAAAQQNLDRIVAFIVSFKTLSEAQIAELKRMGIDVAALMNEAAAAVALAAKTLDELPGKEAREKGLEVVSALRSETEQIVDLYNERVKYLNNYMATLRASGQTESEEYRRAAQSLDRAAQEQAKALQEIQDRTDEWTQFQKRAAEQIQDAFANAFMNIGNGARSFLHDILSAFKQVFAQAISLSLVESLKIKEIISGKGGKGGILGALFGTKDKGAAAAAGDKPTRDNPLPVEVVDNALAQAKSQCECVCACIGAATSSATARAQEIVGRIIDNTAESVMASRDVEGSIAKAADKVGVDLRNLGGYLVNNLKQQKEKKNWLGDLFKFAVDVYVGSLTGGTTAPPMASGGRAKGGLTLVGEEGPEMLMLPGGSRIFNKRQMAFAGGGASLNFQPVYNVVINDAQDAKKTRGELEGYLMMRDKKLKRDIMETLRDNGMGRMR